MAYVRRGACSRDLARVSVCVQWDGRRNLPQALQIVWPSSSRLQRGVIVVPQFWHAMTTVVFWFWVWRCRAPMSMGAVGSSAAPSCADLAAEGVPHLNMLRLALLDMRLLYAGQPLHPSAPPVPLHFPPPGHVPDEVWSSATYVAPGVFVTAGEFGLGGSPFPALCRGFAGTTLGGRLRLVGRAEFLALK